LPCSGAIKGSRITDVRPFYLALFIFEQGESQVFLPVLSVCWRLGRKRHLRFTDIGLYFVLSVIYATGSQGLMNRHDMFITRDF
tara:strand:- start:64197 stop:64448 length:252 start_codon:yes stop_codon:yes gene_type:complete